MDFVLKEKIKVMQHYFDGGDVEKCPIYYSNWTTVIEPVAWNWAKNIYRIKKPKEKKKVDLYLFAYKVENSKKGWNSSYHFYKDEESFRNEFVSCSECLRIDNTKITVEED